MKTLSLLSIALIFLTACSSVNPPPPKALNFSIPDPQEQEASAETELNEQNLYTEEEEALSDSSLPLDLITLPEGFRISLFAGNIKNARSLAQSPEGTIYVGNRSSDKVYALKDRDGDFKADQKFTIASGLNSPNGVAFKDGDLYVAEINRILRFKDIESQLENPPEPEVVTDNYPTDGHHGWKFIRFGPDEQLYVPVGAPCNICGEEDPIYASLTRLDLSTGTHEVIANGIRNTVGFDWHPISKELWFTDNGADWLGDDLPGDELNVLNTEGQHYGFPYCHQGNLDDETFTGRSCDEFTAPVQILGPHVAALGMRFYTGQQFPESYRNQIFIAEHGSWNRSKKIGYQVSMVRQNSDGSTSYEPFAEGWLKGESVWGRPVDVEVLPDGSLLVSDDYANAIYRIAYER